MIPLANHLWQSTIFAAAAVLLSLVLTRNRAQTRYWLWLAASVKFLVPFSWLMKAGTRLVSPTAPLDPTSVTMAVEQISQPFAPGSVAATVTSAAPAVFPAVLIAMWVAGFAAIVLRWFFRWLRVRTAVRAALPLAIDAPVRVMSSTASMEPGVFGIFRPVLLLPEGIAERLTPAQLQAILAHELCHVRRRDNLAAAVHMIVEAAFWFHPLVWWIGARMVDERERACDEEVLRRGSEPYVYAEGILNVCRFYMESPIACAAGVTGSDLRKRIEAIMANRVSYKLTFARKILLAAAGVAAVAGPVTIGIVNAPRIRAQSQEAELAGLKFEVATIKPSPPGQQNSRINRVPGEGLEISNVPLKNIITFAYDVRGFQVTGGPSWIESDRWEIVAKPEKFEGPADRSQMNDEYFRTSIGRMRARVRALLAERFQLAIHKEAKEFPIYALVVAKGGSKLQESKGKDMNMNTGRGTMRGEGSTMEMLTNTLSNLTGRTVRDRTGLEGKFDFKMEWTPEQGAIPPGERQEGDKPQDTTGPSIFTAIQEQLGLKLESTKGPVDVIVIDRVEKPSAN